MNTKTILIAAMASVFAVTAAAPSFAAGDPAKKEKRIHRLMKRADTNHDGKISQSEMAQALAASFAVLDTNHDGHLSKAELDNRKASYKAYRQDVKASKASGERLYAVVRLPKRVAKHFGRIDANKDGLISQAEMEHVAARLFKHRDRNKDGYISTADLKA